MEIESLTDLRKKLSELHDAANRAEQNGNLFAAAAYDRKWHETFQKIVVLEGRAKGCEA